MRWWARAGRELEEVGWDVPKVEAAMVLFLDDEHRYLVTDRGSVVRALTLFVALALVGGCDSCADYGPGTTARHPEIVRAIEAQGFKDVELQDYGAALGFEGCAQDDEWVAHAKATNAFGAHVQILACSGFFWKGVTVRTR